jgi:hypothetical protein
MKSTINDWSRDSHADWPAAVVENVEHHHHSEISRREET